MVETSKWKGDAVINRWYLPTSVEDQVLDAVHIVFRLVEWTLRRRGVLSEKPQAVVPHRPVRLDLSNHYTKSRCDYHEINFPSLLIEVSR